MVRLLKEHTAYHADTYAHELCILFSSGEFGIVYKAHLLPQMELDSKSLRCPLPQTVAVKTLKGMYYVMITNIVDAC